jgi:putative hemolysin
VIKLTIFILFLILSAFFSSAETAFTALNKIRIRNLLEKKAEGTKKLQKILKKPRDLITAILIGNNIVNVAASAMATTVALDFAKNLGFKNLAVIMAIVTAIMTFIILTFGEIVPKTLALKNPEKLALFAVNPIRFTLFIFKPFIILFRYISIAVTKILGMETENTEKLLTSEELLTLLKIGEEEGILEQKENKMIHSIFKFSDTVVREIMTPRTDAVCLNINSSINKAVNLIVEKGHSRIPIYEEKIDNIVGILYAKDMLNVEQAPTTTLHTLRKFLREAHFIPETKNTEELLQQMKKAKFHMAIVADEYGGMAGLVTLEDIIEEIIGEIQDEHDTKTPAEIVSLSENLFLADARMNLDEIGETMGVEFPNSEEYDSLGGFVLHILGKFPYKGEIIKYKNLVMTVKEIMKRRIIKIELKILPKPTEDDQFNAEEEKEA